MGLRIRLNIMITALFLMILAVGTALVIHNARVAVVEEINSTANLALHLIEVAFSAPGAARSPALQENLAHQVLNFEKTRHLHIEMRRIGSSAISSEFGGGEPSKADAPDWFVALVEPEPIEYHKALVVPGAPNYEIVMRADPADEITEAWQGARALLGLLVLFSVTANAAVFFTIGRALRPVDSILRAFERIEQGDYRARLPHFSLPEWGRIAQKFNHMAEVLERSREENRELAQRSLVIQEEERRALAHELHDELGQSISAIKAVAVSIGQRIRDVDSAVADSARTIADVSSHIYDVVRGMMRRLRPVILDELGLVTALEQVIDDWNAHHEDTFCRFSATGNLGNLGEAMNISVYRICQESLTNIAKHANASEVGIELRGPQGAARQSGRLELHIVDNGVGFDPLTTRRGLGLLGIAERVDALDGSFQLITARGTGVQLHIELPVPASREAAA